MNIPFNALKKLQCLKGAENSFPSLKVAKIFFQIPPSSFSGKVTNVNLQVSRNILLEVKTMNAPWRPYYSTIICAFQTIISIFSFMNGCEKKLR